MSHYHEDVHIEKQIFEPRHCLATELSRKRVQHQAEPLITSQQTQNICITFIQCWTNVEDVGPTLHKCYTNALCLLEYLFPTATQQTRHVKRTPG